MCGLNRAGTALTLQHWDPRRAIAEVEALLVGVEPQLSPQRLRTRVLGPDRHFQLCLCRRGDVTGSEGQWLNRKTDRHTGKKDSDRQTVTGINCLLVLLARWITYLLNGASGQITIGWQVAVSLLCFDRQVEHKRRH